MGELGGTRTELALHRVVYYDAIADDASVVSPEHQEYWRQIEILPDTHLGFGSLRGTRTDRPRQKGVDTLMAVDMLVGAFDKLFEVAVLIAGDADFVPVIREVHRRGILVVLAGEEKSTSDDLLRSCDRFVPIGPSVNGWFPRLEVDGRVWSATNLPA